MDRTALAHSLARHIPFWDRLSADEQSLLAKHSRMAEFPAGGHIQGTAAGCAGVIFLLDGRLRAFMLSNEGREITLFHVLPGECCVLAASCIMPMITFDIELDAVEESELIIVDPHAFGTLAQRNAHAEAFTYRQATERFSDCMWVMQQVLFMGLDTRLAIWLTDETIRTGEMRVSSTHEEIARHLGSAREAVSRMLKYFEREGIVSLKRGAVTVIDRMRLRELTQ